MLQQTRDPQPSQPSPTGSQTNRQHLLLNRGTRISLKRHTQHTHTYQTQQPTIQRNKSITRLRTSLQRGPHSQLLRHRPSSSIRRPRTKLKQQSARGSQCATLCTTTSHTRRQILQMHQPSTLQQQSRSHKNNKQPTNHTIQPSLLCRKQDRRRLQRKQLSTSRRQQRTNVLPGQTNRRHNIKTK